jgi:hypothetical protein
VTLEQLKIVSPGLAALLVETCGERNALAAHLVGELSAIAEAAATAAERERCVAHLTVGQRGDMHVAIAAIESGALLEQGVVEQHMAAAAARRTTPLSLVKGDK